MVTYFEDLDEGETHEFGERSVSREEIVAFAEEYDPQPFHVDEEAAAESVFGELVASGWHTAALCMRLLVDGMQEREWASQGARGVDDLRWHRPLRPGDTIAAEIEIVEKHPERGDGAIGHVDAELRGYNQDGDLVISWIGHTMIERREAGGE